MTLPGVNIQLANGRLGGVIPTQDGVAGLAVSGTAVADKINLNEPVQLFGPADLESYGITPQNNALADKEVKAFYQMAGQGAELWLILYSDATTLTDICDDTQVSNPVKKLLDAAQGRIRLLAINRVPDLAYTPTVTNGIDQDVETALVNLQVLLNSYADNYKPVRAFLPGIAFAGSGEGLVNLRQNSQNRVAVVLWADNEQGHAAMGLVLGRAAAIAVHRNLGRVKDGAVAALAWLTDGSEATEKETLWPILHTQGFIFPRKYQGKNGFYFNDDPVAAPLSDDYNSISLGRVIDKAIVIAYTTYVDELLDNVEIGPDGKLPASTCKYFESRINNAVNTLMAGEISGFRSFVNPEQNVLSTGKLTVAAAITPLGTLKEIVVDLGFENPALQQ